MTAVRLATHNCGDVAETPATGWDVQCLTERSSKPLPKHVERHTSKRLKGLAIDWDPDVLTVRKRGAKMAHPGLAKFSPNRGTIWVEGFLTEAPEVKVAVVCSHRLNDPHGARRSFGPIRELIWKVHAAQDRRLFERLSKRGFVVLYGGDINDRTAGLEPLTRLLRGHYDALGYSKGARPVGQPVNGGRLGSDHARYTQTFEVKGR